MINRINTIIEELTNPNIELTSTLLKVQVLAHILKNNKLKEWVNNESNGYEDDKDIPFYRIIKAPLLGNLEQDRGWGSYATRSNIQLEAHHIETKYNIDIFETKLKESFSTYEHMLQQKDHYRINIPPMFYNELSKIYANDWKVSSAWRVLSHHSLKGVLNSIKSNLLQFMLDIADEIGEGDNIDIIKKENVINNLFDKNLGTGNTFNINTGSDIVQTTISGDNSKANIAKGDNINQKISSEDIEGLKKLIDCIKEDIDKATIDSDDLEDLKIQINTIEAQLQRDKPKSIVLKNAFDVIKGIVSGVGAHILTSSTMLELEQIGRVFGL
jgi:hypothetical protein